MIVGGIIRFLCCVRAAQWQVMFALTSYCHDILVLLGCYVIILFYLFVCFSYHIDCFSMQHRHVAVLFRMSFVCVTDNRPIPTDLQKEAISIHKTLDWDDEGAEGWSLTFVLEGRRNSSTLFLCLSRPYLI